MEHSKKAKGNGLQETYVKAAAYCAYQERSPLEVREKLGNYELDQDEVEEILERLKKDNFLNEERFARAFVGGKFRLKKWGRIKIKQELKLRGVSAHYIQQSMQEIDPELYEETLRGLLQKKNEQEKKGDILQKKQKLLRFALSRGYEQDIIWDVINDLLR